jgi:MFS family permease
VTRERRRLFLALFSLTATQTAVYVARPVTSYKLLGIGGNATDVGLVTATFALVPLFVAIPLGRFADRGRTDLLLVAGSGLQALACLLLAAAGRTATIALATAVLGLGHLGLALAVQHVVARESADEQHDQRFAALTVGVSLGQLLGPLVAAAFLREQTGAALVSGSRDAMLVGAAIAAAGCAAASVAARERPRAEAAAPAAEERASLREIMAMRGVPAGIFASIAVLASADVFTAYMPVLGERRGIDPGVVGILLAIRAAASVAARVGIAWIVRRISRVRVISISALVAAVAIAAVTATTDPVVLAGLCVLIGYGLGFGQPLTMTLVVQRVPEQWSATALAVRLSGNRLGQVAGPALAGLIAGGLGVSSVFWLLGALLVASAAAVERPAPRVAAAGQAPVEPPAAVAAEVELE